MSVHYKFKSSKDYDTVAFEGSVISVADLKKEIIRQQKLTKANDFDLEITNAQTREEFKEETYLIPKNTSVIVKRVPASRPAQQHYVTKPQAEGSFAIVPTHGGSGEEDKIQDFLNASVGGYHSTADNKNASRIPNRYNDNKIPPPNYLCHRCNRPGHYIHNCPTNGDPAFDFHKVKKATGIPRAFLKPVEAQSAGSNDAMMIPGGGIVVMQPNSREFDKIKKKFQNEENQIPEDLICPICKSLLRDAVLSPCCANVFCDQCIRRKLLENLNLTCPSCNKSGCSPQSLVANLKIRNMVEKFKQESRLKQNSPTLPNSPANVHSPQSQLINQNSNQNTGGISSGPNGASNYPQSSNLSDSSTPSYGGHNSAPHSQSQNAPQHYQNHQSRYSNTSSNGDQSGSHSHHHSSGSHSGSSNSYVNNRQSSHSSHHSSSSSYDRQSSHRDHSGPVRSYRDRDDRHSSHRHEPYSRSSHSSSSQRRDHRDSRDSRDNRSYRDSRDYRDRDRERERDRGDRDHRDSSRRDKRPYNSQSEWEVPITENR